MRSPLPISHYVTAPPNASKPFLTGGTCMSCGGDFAEPSPPLPAWPARCLGCGRCEPVRDPEVSGNEA